MRKFSTIKKLLTLDEKKERLSFAKEWGETIPNEKQFLEQDIYDEAVLLKCIKCGFEETVEIDIIDELSEMYESEYPELECPHCNKRKAVMVPIDIYNEKVQNKK